MGNDSKLQLMYLMIFLGLSIAQLNFFMTLFLLNQKNSHVKRTSQVSNNNKETGNQKETAISKTRTARRSCCVKKGRTKAYWESFITCKVPESEWKNNFRMS